MTHDASRPHPPVIPLGELAPTPTATGDGEVRLVNVHGAPRFLTEWLAGDDPTWTSKR